MAVHEVLNAPAYRPLNRRTVEGIQRKITEKRERNLFSRLLNARSDKRLIFAWNSDLNTFLHVFNVCPTIPARILLTVHSQTELPIATDGIAPDVHQNVVDTPAMVPEIPRGVVGGQEATDGQHSLVSDIHTRSAAV